MDRTRLPNGQRTGDVSAVVDAMHELGPSFIESTLQHALAGKHPIDRSIDRIRSSVSIHLVRYPHGLAVD